MLSFDFIEDPSFRESLQKDHAEMERCFQHEAWKSVQVLAGSIVEALLIDYLVASNTGQRQKDPLKMDLGDAISVCRSEKVLSDRSADLCSVVRSYRNLIHPGRVIRQNEAQPSVNSARIAVSLIEMICEEVAKVRQSTFGFTAEQIIAKVERDPNAMAILKHLLEDLNFRQKQRLLLDVLPTRYFELHAKDTAPLSDVDYSVELFDLRRVFRTVFDSVDDELKATVAQRFIQVLREEDGEYVVTYGDAFFLSRDLRYLPENQRAIVKDHIFSRVGSVLTEYGIGRLEGIETFLEPADVHRWVDPIVRAIVSTALSESAKSDVYTYVTENAWMAPSAVDQAARSRLNMWEKYYASQNRENDAEAIGTLNASWPDDLPF
jgi:hypothetical protein